MVEQQIQQQPVVQKRSTSVWTMLWFLLFIGAVVVIVFLSLAKEKVKIGNGVFYLLGFIALVGAIIYLFRPKPLNVFQRAKLMDKQIWDHFSTDISFDPLVDECIKIGENLYLFIYSSLGRAFTWDDRKRVPDEIETGDKSSKLKQLEDTELFKGLRSEERRKELEKQILLDRGLLQND